MAVLRWQEILLRKWPEKLSKEMVMINEIPPNNQWKVEVHVVVNGFQIDCANAVLIHRMNLVHPCQSFSQ